jgi:glycosyl transferase family 87
VVFVALNPIYLIYAMGGFHNDFILLVPSMGAILLLLERRYRAAGAVLMLAVAIKFSALLLLPFLLVATRAPQARRQLVIGAVLAALPLAALSVALFGFSIPNLQDQSTLLTNFSIPNVFGLLIGVGGAAPALLRVGNVALVVTIALLLRRRHDWLSQAGWGTLALIASLAWLVPWYVVWLLPLAALGTSLRLRRAALVLTVYLVFAFAPMTGLILSSKGIDLLSSPVGQASRALQAKLQSQPPMQP